MDQETCQYRREDYTIDTDRRRLDLGTIHGYLTHSYWCPGIPREVLAKAIDHSLCFGLYQREEQIGFARVVTDYARFAYLCDLFVLKPYRGQGLGKWLVEGIVNCPLLQGIRVMWLGTRDAHGLYAKYGFKALEYPGSMMEIRYQMPWFRPELIEE